MRLSSQHRVPSADRGPLGVMFVITSMPVGGAETLLVNLVRRLDRERCTPQVCCLKEPGPLGEEIANEVPVHSRLLAGKFDLRVLPRLTKLLRTNRIDAVVTVGAGDKMFWGRLAAWRAGVPVVISALHSTGWPDRVGRLNRLLTPLTDAFVAVAEPHGRYLREVEGFPAAKVRVIRNGVDTERFRPKTASRAFRRQLGLPPDAPVAGIVAALRPEKNHELLLHAARRVVDVVHDAKFLIVGDGPRRSKLESLVRELDLEDAVRWLGVRSDVPELLSAIDVFVLTSHNEASPVSILEAMASGRPVVATDVGSVSDAVTDGVTGYLIPPGGAQSLAKKLAELLTKPELAQRMGEAGRAAAVEHGSLSGMVRGYERLITEVYDAKCVSRTPRQTPFSPADSRDRILQ